MGENQGFRELDRVWAPRHMPWGVTKEVAIVHRIHGTVLTVQFPSDQHRIRILMSDVQKMDDFEPEYPVIRMHPGAKMPSSKEVQMLDYERKIALAQGLPEPPLPPGFSMEDPGKLKDKHISRVQHWGISEPTLDALRNRTLPAANLTGYYNRHFYSKLYENNFYRNGYKREDAEPEPQTWGVVGQRYYSLDHPPVEFTEEGTWKEIKEPQELTL